MVSVLELALYWFVNTITTITIVVFTERYFKRKIDKALENVEKEIKKMVKKRGGKKHAAKIRDIIKKRT